MHTEPLPDSAGDFGDAKPVDQPCRTCGKNTMTVRVWESSDGAYEDCQYKCTSCGHGYWVEGPDS